MHVKEYINIQWIRILLACLIGIAFVYGYDVLGIGLFLCSYGLYFMAQEEGGHRLSQGIILIALAYKIPSVIYLLSVWIIVEFYFYLKKKKTTIVFDLVLCLLCLVQTRSYLIANVLVFVGCIVLIFSFILFNPFVSKKIILFSSLGFVLYVILGAFIPFIPQPQIQSSIDTQQFFEDSKVKEQAKILSDNGEALEERIRLISQAKEEIILSTFEFDADISGQQMLAALLDASHRGVQVSILVDGFPYLKAMANHPAFLALSRQENVEIRQYNALSLFRPWTFMGRMHDKYLIVDDLGYIMGGRNTYDFFLGDQEGYKNADWDIFVLGNQSIKEMKSYFKSVWNLDVCKKTGEQWFWKNHPAVNQAQQELLLNYETMRNEQASWFEWSEKGMVEVDRISLISNPPHIFAKEPLVFHTMTQLMQQASDSVMIHTPYIICNDYMLEQLSKIPHAQMMTNSVVNNGNPFGAMDYQMNKDKIIETGVQLLEYEQGISYHGKCFTMDGLITGIGSFNWDMRSAYLDTEVMVIVKGEDFNELCRQAMKVYEDEALWVLDENSYLLKEGQRKKEATLGQKIQLKFLQIFASWARFLM